MTLVDVRVKDGLVRDGFTSGCLYFICFIFQVTKSLLYSVYFKKKMVTFSSKKASPTMPDMPPLIPCVMNHISVLLAALIIPRRNCSSSLRFFQFLKLIPKKLKNYIFSLKYSKNLKKQTCNDWYDYLWTLKFPHDWHKFWHVNELITKTSASVFSIEFEIQIVTSLLKTHFIIDLI